MRRSSKIVRDIETTAERDDNIQEPERELFSTGSTELNLACSDTIFGAFPSGCMINIIGDSHAGKTFLAHSIITEITLRQEFNDYNMLYDNAEAADTTGIAKMFGKTLIDRLTYTRSSVVHDFKIAVWKLLKADKPFIYVLDSLDSLTTKEAEKQLDAAIAGEKEKGSYGLEKARVLSNILGPICRKLESTKSLLIILSQTRENINPSSFQEKTRSGGKALKFYASYEMWLALVGKHKKKVGEFERIIGACTRVKVTKNKLTGKVREAEFNIYVDYGIDDIGTCIDFLERRGKFWSKEKNTIIATDLKLEGTKEKLIRQIEEKNLEPKLRHVMGKAWKKIEDGLRLNRKSKYK